MTGQHRSAFDRRNFLAGASAIAAGGLVAGPAWAKEGDGFKFVPVAMHPV